MANTISAAKVASATLTGGQVDFVFLSSPGVGVNVINLTGTAPIWFTVSEPGGPCPAPTIGGQAGVFCSASVAGQTFTVRHAGMYGTVVQLISSGAPTYLVEVTGTTVDA